MSAVEAAPAQLPEPAVPAPATGPVAALPPLAAVAKPPPAATTDAPEEESDPKAPWVLRLGNYLTRAKSSTPSVPAVLRLGTYLHDKQPGPWSILANEKPHDPLVSSAPPQDPSPIPEGLRE